MSLRFLGLSGSLRAESTNAAVLRTLADLLPDGVSLDLYDYRDVPLYDPDAPELAPGVVRLRDAITAADAVVIATPEYNYSVPGVLKNAIDHASRPAYQSPFRNKPVGVLSASPGLQGGARAQQHLKTILLGMGAPVFPWPEVAVSLAGHAITDGRVTDPGVLKLIQDYANGLVAWVSKVR